MARRKQEGITQEQKIKIGEIVEFLAQASKRCDELEEESEKVKSYELYPELLQAIHLCLGDERLYRLKQTIMDADDSEMRSPK